MSSKLKGGYSVVGGEEEEEKEEEAPSQPIAKRTAAKKTAAPKKKAVKTNGTEGSSSFGPFHCLSIFLYRSLASFTPSLLFLHFCLSFVFLPSLLQNFHCLTPLPMRTLIFVVSFFSFHCFFLSFTCILLHLLVYIIFFHLCVFLHLHVSLFSLYRCEC